MPKPAKMRATFGDSWRLKRARSWLLTVLSVAISEPRSVAIKSRAVKRKEKEMGLHG